MYWPPEMIRNEREMFWSRFCGDTVVLDSESSEIVP
jgi:hypothetical protein